MRDNCVIAAGSRPRKSLMMQTRLPGWAMRCNLLNAASRVPGFDASSGGCSEASCLRYLSRCRCPRCGRNSVCWSALNISPPIRSACWCAVQATSAASSDAITDLKRPRVAKNMGARASRLIKTGRSRSSRNSLVWVLPVRAVTRQSMLRTSSPG